MRNLKKILSLTMAFVLVLGIMVTASAATVSDEDKIENLAAFELLSGLEIMVGRASGSFDPQGTLTRAETAKMIYVARTGGYDDKAEMFKGAKMFSDVSSTLWSEGYINYAGTKGFVVGRLNGTFDPEGKISGYEFMKILLCALGYDSKLNGFENNARWQSNVITLAKETGLAENYKGNPSAAITRDEAALIMANMIYLNTVSYNTNNLLVEGVSFGEKYLGLERVSGILVANEYAAIDGSVCKSGKSTLKIGTELVTLPVASTIDQLGYNMTALLRVKNNMKLVDEAGKYNSDAIAKVYSELTQTLGQNTVKTFGVDTADTSVQYFVNYSENKAVATKYAASDITALGQGNKVIAISNDGNDKYDLVIARSYTAATVSSITTDGTYYIGSVKMTSKNAVGLENLAKGDYVRFYQVANDGMFIVEKATIITAKASGFTAEYVVIDGVKYKPAEGVATADYKAVKDVNLTSDSVYYVFDGFIYKVENTATSSNYAYVIKSTILGWEHKVSVVLDNGQVKDYTVANAAKLVDDVNNDKIPSGIYTYSIDDNGMIVLTDKQLVAAAPSADISYTKGSNTLIDSKYVNSTTVAFLYDGSKWTVAKGIGNIPSFKADKADNADMYLLEGTMIKENDLVQVVVINKATVTGTAATTQYIVLSDVVNVADNKVSFTAFNGTENVAMISSDKSVVKGGIYTFAFGTNNVVTEAHKVTGKTGFVTFADDKTLQLSQAEDGGDVVLAYSDKTVVLNVDLKTGTVGTGMKVENIDKYSKELLAEQVENTYSTLVVMNEGVITHIYTFAQIQTAAN